MTSQYITRGLRWFFDEKLPAQVDNWFKHDLPGDNMYSPVPATDLCFLVKHKPDFRLKLREGKLRLKWRTFMKRFSTRDKGAEDVQSTMLAQGPMGVFKSRAVPRFAEPSDLQGTRIEVRKDQK